MRSLWLTYGLRWNIEPMVELAAPPRALGPEPVATGVVLTGGWR